MAGTEHLYRRPRSKVWQCWYYDKNGEQVRKSTGQTDKEAARSVLAQWEQDAVDPTEGASAKETLNDALQRAINDRKTRARDGTGSARTVKFYESCAANLVRHFENDFRISNFKDSTRIKKYIDAERAKGVKDALVKKDLILLRLALRLAQEAGTWSGNPKIAMPKDMREVDYAPRKRSPTREEILKLIPHLTANSAAAVCFVLATSAETSAVEAARSSDLPKSLDMAEPKVRVRGTKHERRDREVNIITDEQRTLLRFVMKHAGGEGSKLFSSLSNFKRDLRDACVLARIEMLSPHPLRHAAGQWLWDLGVNLSDISATLAHGNTRITEEVYLNTRNDTGARMLAAVPTKYAKEANRHRGKEREIETIKKLPEPGSIVFKYKFRGEVRTLTEWAQVVRIPKLVIFERVEIQGMSFEAAIKMGPPSKPKRSQRVRGGCDTGVINTPDGSDTSNTRRSKIPGKMVGAAGFEPTTLRPPV